MQKLKSFEQFATEAKISQTRKLEEEAGAKRNNSAEAFKSLLSEFKVTSIKELTEEQRSEFFTKLRNAELNESLTLIEEGTRGQFGKIDKKGNIVSVYTHYDSYPENMLPLIKKGYKDGKNVDDVIAKGDNSGLEATVDKMNFYGDKNAMTPSKGSITNISKYLRDVANNGGAEFVYLWDEANKQWLMADIYGNGYDELVPAFESVEINERGRTAKDMEGIYVSYAVNTKKTELFIVAVETGWDFSFSQIADTTKEMKAPKEFTDMISMIGQMPEEKWLKFYKKLPKPGDIVKIEKGLFESIINEAIQINEGKAKGLDWCISQLGDKPSCMDVASFVYDNYDKVTGLRKSMRNDEMDFPLEIMDVVEHYGLDIDEFTECYGMAAESLKITEAIQVEGKRDAKKVVTVYNNLFAKRLVDFNAMSPESMLGAIKYLFEMAMEDANFGREGFEISKNIKGNIGTFEVKMPGLGGYYIKIGATTVKRVLDQYYTDISSAASWRGIAIVEGTALYLEQIRQEAMGQSLINAFNVMFNESKVNEATVEMDAMDPDDKDFLKFLKKHKVTIVNKVMDGPGGGHPVITMQGSRKDLEKVLADEEFGWADPDLAEYIEEGAETCSINLKVRSINEAEVNSDEEFVEYTMTVLKKAFGDKFDEVKAKQVADGILAKSKGDYGVAVGMLTSSLGA